MQGKGLIVGRNPSQKIPKDFLELARKDTNAFGGVIVDTSDGKTKLLVSLLDQNIPIEQLLEIQDQYEAHRTVLFFGTFPAGYDGSVVQPFELIVGDNDMPKMVAFLEGDFSAFADDAHKDKTNEHMAFTEMLRPTVVDLYNSLEQDLDGLVNAINHDKKIMKTLQLMSPSRGHITLVAANGTMIDIKTKNDLFREYPWGWTSNHLGYTGDAKSNLPAALKKKLFGKIAVGEEKKADPPPLQPDIKPPENPPAETKPKTDTAVPATAGKENIGTVTAILHEREKDIRLSTKVLTVPSNLRGRPRKNWCNTHLGYLPRNWKDDTIELTAYVAVKKLGKGEEIKSFQDPRLANALGSKPAGTPPAATEEQKKLPAALRRKLGLKTGGNTETTKSSTPTTSLPIIPKEELQGLHEWQKKFTGYDGKEIVIDPELMPALAEECPSYAEQTGRNGLEMIFYWHLTDIEDHIKKYPKATKVLIKNLINWIAEHHKAEHKEQPATDKSHLPAALRRKAG